MATIFRSPILVTVYKLPKAQPEYTVNLQTLYAPNPDRPFRQLDWPLAARPKPPQDAAAPANRNPLIYPNPSRPFHQDGWDRPTSARPQATGEADATQNPLLTPNPAAPFSQSEWRLTARVQLSLKSESYRGAFPLYSPNPSAPFRQQLWDSAAKTPPKAGGEAIAGDLPLLTVVIAAAPFAQTDWLSSGKKPSLASDSYAGSYPLLTPNPAQPFAWLDWSWTPFVYKAKVDDFANLLPVQAVVVGDQPFSQSDWPNPVVGFATNNGTWINLGLTDGDTPVVEPPPVVVDEIRHGGGGYFRGVGERRRIKGRTVRDDLDRIWALLEQANLPVPAKLEQAVEPGASEAEVIQAALTLPDFSETLSTLDVASGLIVRLERLTALAREKARREAEDEEGAIIALLFA